MSAATIRQARNDNPQRLQLLRSLTPPTLNGIDYLEIASADQRTLLVVFVHPVTGLTKDNLHIDGGVRIVGIEVVSAVVDPPPNDNRLRVTVDAAGDSSWYQLSLVDPADPEQTPDHFDPCLSSIRFTFKAQCSTEFDCEADLPCAPATFDEPPINYLAKDYASFRKLMLDRMGQLIPGGQEVNPADFSVALVELLAHVGDGLSAYQDAVATEAYLGTARRRVSLRRHARLLDYPLHEGCNARAFVTIAPRPEADGKTITAPATLLAAPRTRMATRPVKALESLPDGDSEAFMTLHDVTLRVAQNEIAIHTWGDPDFCLGRGTTSAALRNDPALGLSVGDVLVLEEALSPTTGLAQDVNRSHRQAVRVMTMEAAQDPLGAIDPVTNLPIPLEVVVVTWHPDDALAFSLCVSATVARGGETWVAQVAVARGNVVLADHGFAITDQAMRPPTAPVVGNWRPLLDDGPLAFAEPYEHRSVIEAGVSAAAALVQDPRAALPAAMRLVADDPLQFGDQADAGALPWNPIPDLLDSDRYAQKFVVETESNGGAQLRFGDNRLGARPDPDTRLLASYRVGGGTRGNVGADAISALVTDDVAIADHLLAVRNPIAASGGSDPESADAIKLFAPEAFRTQERAVTEDDHARMAERHPQVQRAAARLRWTGSWYTMFLIIDRRGGKPLDADFRAMIVRHLERYRLTGYDLEVVEPAFVPLDIALVVCVLPTYFAADVKQALLARLGNRDDARGGRGFFHPDGFTFGQALPLSRLIEAAMAVTGVASIEVKTFQRFGKTGAGEIAAGILNAAPLEILRLDNDPNFPESGRLVLSMQGGA